MEEEILQPIVDIDEEMRASYLDYAMSVIVSRALPDARDGLKPVHRRILYAMYDMNLRPDSPYRKSARIVGEVLGKYHPHSDAAVYETLVRMAQEFSMRYALVDGQGNFGSIDGDAAAAMRYTEARMTAVGADMLADIEKNTVNFTGNFDGSLTEPMVLPSNIPNLIVNGSSGIAVGMSTSIPPHNLGEVCDALMYMLDSWDNLDEVGLPEIMQFIKGPDFPTGGLIFRNRDGTDALAQAYGGRGKLTVQAKVHVEQLSRNRNRIIITELPYQVNKTSLVERIAELAREGEVEGITDLRDESDRQGLRIVIDLTRTVEPEDVLSILYKRTPMRSTFSVIMLALVDGEPRILTLKRALQVYLEHRLVIVRRRSEHDLAHAKERAHILEGYLIALDNLDEVIDTIRRSRTVETAHENLRKAFKLSDEQAQAILDMPLRRLAALERKRIQDEYKEKQELIKFLTKLLKSQKMMRDLIKEELGSIKQRYGDPRRTLIIEGTTSTETVTMTDLAAAETTWVAVTWGGLIGRTYGSEQPKISVSDKEPPKVLLEATLNETLYLFTADGMAATIPVHQVPPVRAFEEGAPFHEICPLDPEQEVVEVLTRIPGENEGYLFLTTVGGMVKRIASEDLPGLSARAFQVIGLTRDALSWAAWTTGENEVVLVSAEGMAIRFQEEDVRPMGLPAAGVKGIKLGGRNDQVVGMDVVDPKANLWVVTRDGFAKSSAFGEYPTQGRYGQGVITIKFETKDGLLAASTIGMMDDTVLLLTDKGRAKYMRLSIAPRKGRATLGKSVIALTGGMEVARIARIRARQGMAEPET